MFPILTVALPMIQTALTILGQFKGSAVEAKASGYVQDAVGVITALSPLIESFSNGTEVTEEDLRVALAGKDAAIAALDAMIAQKGG